MKNLTTKMKKDWFDPVEKRDGGFICFYCRKSLSLTHFVYDHLNDNRRDNRIENVVFSCYRCNVLKIDDIDMQLNAQEKLGMNDISNSMGEKISSKPRELKELDISKENYEIAEEYVTKEVDLHGSVIVTEVKNCISYLCRQANGTGSPQAVTNYLNTLTCKVAPFEISKNKKGKKIIRRKQT